MRRGLTLSPYEDKNYLWMSCRILPGSKKSVVAYTTMGYRNAVLLVCLAVANIFWCHEVRPIKF